MARNSNNNHLKIGELPCLSVVSLSSLLFHEEPDETRRLNLVNRLGAEAVLKNPPIVAEYGARNKYVILDGANRISALSTLGFKHTVVQVVDFDDDLLSLYSWNHAVERLDRGYFSDRIKDIAGIEMVEGDFNRLDQCRFLCHLTFREADTISVTVNGSLAKQIKKLKEVTDLYLDRPLSDRVSYTNLEHLKKHYPDFQTLITFRLFTKEDFRQMLKSGIKLPAGITRIFLPKRALGLNIPLEFMKSNLTLEEKNNWLEDVILKRVREKSIRFYREPTFVFDE